MDNFTGTEWEGMTEEDIFLSNRKLVKTTISRKFPSNQAFCKAHMLDLDDLIQLGNIGLLNAIRTFDKSKSSFRSHAINRIVWSISTSSKVDSLRSKNTQTTEIANVVSVEDKVSEDLNITFLDTLESKESTSEDAEDKLLQQSVIAFLKADKEVDDELLYILIAKTNGMSTKEIAQHFGTHPNTIGQRLRTQRTMRVKNRLMKFLKNGEQ